MIRLDLLLALFVCDLRTPPHDKFGTVPLTSIKRSGSEYHYTVENAIDGFVGKTWKPLKLKEGQMVRATISHGCLYLVDNDGKIQETLYFMQFLKAPLRTAP